MNAKTKKTLGLLLAVAMIVCLSVAGTLAYLTSETEDVVNTFTVGKVAITLDEAKTDVYGVKATPEERVKKNEYKLIPGHNYAKDPTVHVDATSENCYLFVKVTNDIVGLETAGDKGTIATQMQNNGWVKLESATDVYYKASAVNAGSNHVVFEDFTIATDAVFTGVGTATDITIEAYAVQADSFGSAAAAWQAAPLTAWVSAGPTA